MAAVAVARTVHFRPVEADDAAVLHREEEAVRVEPRLLLAHPQVAERPRPLLRMFGEGAVVDLEPLLVVLTDDERPNFDTVRPLRRRHRREQGPAHLPQRALLLEAHRLGQWLRAGVHAMRAQA